MAAALVVRYGTKIYKTYDPCFYLPGDNSETGVLEGDGLCPGGRKCDGDPLFEPPPPR